jgi:hypothetical protein
MRRPGQRFSLRRAGSPAHGPRHPAEPFGIRGLLAVHPERLARGIVRLAPVTGPRRGAAFRAGTATRAAIMPNVDGDTKRLRDGRAPVTVRSKTAIGTGSTGSAEQRREGERYA